MHTPAQHGTNKTSALAKRTARRTVGPRCGLAPLSDTSEALHAEVDRKAILRRAARAAGSHRGPVCSCAWLSRPTTGGKRLRRGACRGPPRAGWESSRKKTTETGQAAAAHWQRDTYGGPRASTTPIDHSAPRARALVPMGHEPASSASHTYKRRNTRVTARAPALRRILAADSPNKKKWQVEAFCVVSVRRSHTA